MPPPVVRIVEYLYSEYDCTTTRLERSVYCTMYWDGYILLQSDILREHQPTTLPGTPVGVLQLYLRYQL
jgi:hypothetical protein